MLLILISWVYILFTTINLGYLFDKIVGIKNNNLVITSFFGLFITTILASFWAFFGRINIEFSFFILVVNFLILLLFRKKIISIYQLFYFQIKSLPRNLLIFLILISILIIAQCASIPFLIDNESYYIQTTKWLNEYGFVKGIANLHLFLGQTSGWHITQSAFNFSFLYKNFNDISGFCLLLGNMFAIQKLNDYSKNFNINYLIIGLIPLLNLFFFQFISAPSPDLPVYILSFIIFLYFIENYKNPTNQVFNSILILVLFAVYIKITAITLILFPILFYIKNVKKNAVKLLTPISISVITLSFFVAKNSILSGYPLYPIQLFQIPNIDYAVPKNIIHYMFYELHPINFTTTIQTLFYTNSIDRIFNLLTVFMVFISPIIIYKKINDKAIWIVYFITLLQILLMLIFSPQYRFYIHFVFFLGIILFLSFFKNLKFIHYLFSISIVILFIFLFVPINYNSLTENRFLNKNSTFSLQNIIFPYKNSRYKTDYNQYQIGNLNYNSPVENDFFWSTGNGDLPCVNKLQIDYFEKNFKVIPQMRTNDLKDGFYAKHLSENE